jgi:choline dehydrogenase-like flavoprotein
MRVSPLRRHLAGLSMVGEDLPQEANRVDLDPTLRDVYGFPVPRITHSSHAFELAASSHFGPRLGGICAAAPGAIAAGWLPVGALAEASGGFGSPYAGPASTAHIMGTARMGNDPATSVVDRWGRMHELENVYVADGSVFVSSGGFNPTLTIMALSLRMARHLARG